MAARLVLVAAAICALAVSVDARQATHHGKALTAGFSPTQYDHVIHKLIQQEEPLEPASKIPTGAKCFLWLSCSFVVVGFVIWFVTQLQHARATGTSGETFEKYETVFDKAFNLVTMANARTALAATPGVGITMLYIVFRARTQLIPTSDETYEHVAVGMVFATVGLMILFLDALNIRLQSSSLGNLSSALGNFFALSGFVFLLYGLFAVRSNKFPHTVYDDCFVALAFLYVTCLAAASLVLVTKQASDVLGTPSLERLSIEQRANDIRSAAVFAPTVMLVVAHMHLLPWTSKDKVHEVSSDLAIVTTVGVFLQGFGAVCGASSNPSFILVSRLTRRAGIVITYAFFAALMYCIVDVTSPSVATQNMEVLLVALAIVMAVQIGVEESLRVTDSTEADMSNGRIADLRKLTLDLTAAAQYSLVLAIFLFYIHYRAELLLLEKPSDNIEGYKYLQPAIYGATGSVFANMFAPLFEFVTGSTRLANWISTIGLFGVQISMLGLVAAAVSD